MSTLHAVKRPLVTAGVGPWEFSEQRKAVRRTLGNNHQMKQAKNSPPTNVLRAGVTPALLDKALARSGYPLQTMVADQLRRGMLVQQEWSYRDRDTLELRALDIRANTDLYNAGAKELRVRPHLDLLIECKQSDLPFVFFLSSDKPWRSECPLFAGLHHYDVEVHTDDDRSTWSFDIKHLLSLSDHLFLSRSAPHCSTFSKCVRKSGENLELSGTEAYQGIVLPLVKALSHLRDEESPSSTAVYFDLHIGLAVAVLDAPMVGITVTPKGNEQELIPWVRVIRHEYVEGGYAFDRSRLFAIDVVHRDFLESYVEEHAIPFAEELATRAVKHHEEIASGLGFASGLGADSWSNIEPRLTVAPSGTKRRHK